MENSVKGYLILHRIVLHTLLEECKRKKKVNELEVYAYLFYKANYSKFPIKKRYYATKGQIEVSANELATYFKVARNTMTDRLEALENKWGFIKTVIHSNACNVYEIVNYGDVNGIFEQPTEKNEQPTEQPKKRKSKKSEQPKSIDIFSESDNFSKGIEQPTEQPTKENVSKGEQHYLININNNNLIPTTIYPSYTGEKNFLDSVRDNEQVFERLLKQYNIERECIERKFDNFYVEQLEKNKQYENQDDAKWHFVRWFEKILKQCYGTEIFETFKDFSTKPKELKHPLRMLTANQITEFAKELCIPEKAFKKHLKEFLETANDYRFVSFEEEKKKLFSFVNTASENLPF